MVVKKLRHLLMTLLLASTLAFSLAFICIFSAPAWAIHRVETNLCLTRTDFLKFNVLGVDNETYPFCFADAGRQADSLPNVVTVETGSNYVQFIDKNNVLYPRAKRPDIWFCKNQKIKFLDFRPTVIIVAIHPNPAVAVKNCQNVF
jgi:hypothetical protein